MVFEKKELEIILVRYSPKFYKFVLIYCIIYLYKFGDKIRIPKIKYFYNFYDNRVRQTIKFDLRYLFCDLRIQIIAVFNFRR